MSFDDPALLADFVIEAREHLADIEGQLLSIEAAGADIDVDLVNTVFRAIHSIKGAAGFMGLSNVNGLSHSLENLLGMMRIGELIPTSPIIDTMLKAADALSGLINNIEDSNEIDVSLHIAALTEVEASTSSKNSVTSDAARPTTHGPQAELSDHTPLELLSSTTSSMDATPVHPASARASSAAAETNIRVSVGVLDRLMNLAGELVLGRNQLLQTINNSDTISLQAVAARLDQVTSELQEAIMQTRMQPIGNVFSKFPRIVRDLSARLGKQCQVLMEGGEVEVDKTIIEAISDPLTHMVRNSVDHGIESPTRRTEAGKDATGTLTLKAYHQAGKVCIDIVDNGGGIDTEKLKEKAIDKGIITAERAETMTDREAVWLVFHPGFSTAEKVSDISGRGVGMDVVRTNIEKIGGAVDIESKLGSGTSIRITLPLTLAIIPSMLIRCEQRRFAIPQVNIVELVRVRASETGQRINKVKGAHVLRLRGTLLPLVELHDVLGIPQEPELNSVQKPRQVVIVESGQFRYGLVVDEIDDSEEIVVKPLGKHLRTCHCLAGATILGDGHVAPILDVSGIAAHCELRTRSEEANVLTAAGPDERSEELQRLLLFTNGPREHFAVAMSLIARIERIRTEQIDSVGGQQLLQYRGSSLPLLSIERYLQAASRPTTDHVHVVVFQVHGRELGLIAAELKDIREVSAEIDGDTFREPGVAGSMVIDGNTTRLIDPYELAFAAHPQWFSDKPKSPVSEDRRYTILLAEDSGFFRKQAKEYLESEGFDILDFEDGVEAWEHLGTDEHGIDLVITDIEMPRMNGFELTRRIKTEPRLEALPVVALTSLASEEDHRRGLEAGVDDYQIKMDRERVMSAVCRLLKQPRLAHRERANINLQG